MCAALSLSTSNNCSAVSEIVGFLAQAKLCSAGDNEIVHLHWQINDAVANQTDVSSIFNTNSCIQIIINCRQF